MKPLEDILRDFAKAGRLNHLSIAWTSNGWDVGYRGVAHTDHRHAQHSDVVCAVQAALTGRPGEAPVKRNVRKPPKDEDLLV